MVQTVKVLKQLTLAIVHCFLLYFPPQRLKLLRTPPSWDRGRELWLQAGPN